MDQNLQTQTRDHFFERGWCRFPYDPLLAAWIEDGIEDARQTLDAPEQAVWLRCGGTWFAGVNALPNDAHGAVPGGRPLGGAAFEFIANELGLTGIVWDRAQVSICYPGYPIKGDHETEAAARFRRNRDAAHVDGLSPEGPKRRRHLREHHGFLLGIPMVEVGAGASPLVVWEGSHELMRAAFTETFADLAPESWGDVDVTDDYQAARRRAFDACKRVVVGARPGEAYLLHRLALHGVAPWAPGAGAGPDGRMICYFRPEVGGPEDWLRAT
ncbi:MAG: hypothetical protein GY948_19390 [Alphaproteobacteria bacterium]|nr:hypothetical protein [Alphaproteobacteria bacterium]